MAAGGAAAHLQRRHVDRRDRRLDVLDQRQIVETGDRELLRHGDALRQSLEQHAQRDHVVAADERARQMLAVDELRQSTTAVADGVGDLYGCIGVQAKTVGYEPLADRFETLARAVVAGGDAGDHADAAVAERDQVIDDGKARLAVGEADIRPAPARIVSPGVDVDRAAAIQRLIGGIGMIVADQEQAFDATLEQPLHLDGFRVEVVVGDRNQQRVFGSLQLTLEGVDAGGENRVVQGRDHRADGVGPVGGKRPRAGVREVAELRHDGRDTFAQRRLDQRRAVENARHRGRGNPGLLRNVELRRLAFALGHVLSPGD